MIPCDFFGILILTTLTGDLKRLPAPDFNPLANFTRLCSAILTRLRAFVTRFGDLTLLGALERRLYAARAALDKLHFGLYGIFASATLLPSMKK